MGYTQILFSHMHGSSSQLVFISLRIVTTARGWSCWPWLVSRQAQHCGWYLRLELLVSLGSCPMPVLSGSRHSLAFTLVTQTVSVCVVEWRALAGGYVGAAPNSRNGPIHGSCWLLRRQYLVCFALLYIFEFKFSFFEFFSSSDADELRKMKHACVQVILL